MLEDDDKVIREADESCTARESRHYQTCEPLIKHLVQVDVRQDWANYSLNTKDNFIFERALRYR